MRLWLHGLQFELGEEALPASSVLEGKSFVVSGVFSLVSRNELKKLIETNGGKLLGGVSKNNDYLVAGENMGPSKLQKARDLNVQIIDESTFLKMIEEA